MPRPRNTGPSTAPARSPWNIAVEGTCAKLSVYQAGDRTFLAFGTYGLDTVAFGTDPTIAAGVHPAQGFAEFTDTQLTFDPNLMRGLPLRSDGYLEGDLEVGATTARMLWLAQIETQHGREPGTLFETRRRYFSFGSNGWRPSARERDPAMAGLLAPKIPEDDLCQGYSGGVEFATHASKRLPTGEAVVAGRCQNPLHHAVGGVRALSFHDENEQWKLHELPTSALFDSIVNVGITFASRENALLYVWPPYDDSSEEPYVVSLEGSTARRWSIPWKGSVTSMATSADGTVWAIAAWKHLWRFSHEQWAEVQLPPPAFVDPAPTDLRLLEVTTIQQDVWIHAAYPIVVSQSDTRGGRGHVLFTTRSVAAPRFCDQALPAIRALSTEPRTLNGASLH